MKITSLYLAAGVCVALLVALSRHAPASNVPVMNMDAHMQMTVKTPMQPGDQARADAVLAAAKMLMSKYADVNTAQEDGFVQYKPELKLAQAHFTNWAYAKEAWSGKFDPMHPTSLMYDRTANGGWRIAGVMYTANPSASEDQLNAAVPLSIAQWHRHTDLCTGPPGTTMHDYLGPNARFGLRGSIADETSCAAAGGTWTPQLYGWMLHVWPTQSGNKIWELHPGGDSMQMHDGGGMQMQMHR